MINKKLTVKNVAAIGVMAALVFVSLRISFPIPLSPGVQPTRIHLGNGVILLSGLLLGGWRGGLAAGIGAFLFDVTDPIYYTAALFSLCSRFLMGWVCGAIAHAKSKQGASFRFNLTGAVSGSVLYIILYLIRKFLETLTMQKGYWEGISFIFSGNFDAGTADVLNALSITGSAGITSSINAVFGIIISVAVCTTLKKALIKANVTI